MAFPGIATDENFESAFIDSFNRFPITIGGSSEHPRAANLHAAYYGLTTINADIPEELTEAIEEKKDLTPEDARELAIKCARLFVPYWCEGDENAYFFYTLARPVVITDLPSKSIEHCLEWMKAAENQFLEISEKGSLITAKGIIEIPCFQIPGGKLLNLTNTRKVLEEWIKIIIQREQYDFQSLATLNLNLKANFKDFDLGKVPFRDEVHLLTLSAVGAVLIREVFISDLNQSMGWKIEHRLKDSILYEQDLSFPDLLEDSSIAYYLIPHKELRKIFAKHNVPKERHWEYVRYATKRNVYHALKKIIEEFPIPPLVQTDPVVKEKDSYLKLFWDKADLDSEIKYSEAQKLFNNVSYWLTKRLQVPNIKLEGVFKALYEEGRFENEAIDAVLALLKSDESNCVDQYRNLQKVLDVNAHPHYLLSKIETEAYLVKLETTRNIDGILKPRLNNPNVLKRDGAEDAITGYFKSYILAYSNQIILSEDWEEIPALLMKTYAASSIGLEKLNELIIELLYDAFINNKTVSVEQFADKLQEILESEQSAEVSRGSEALEVEHSSVRFYEISVNGDARGLFSKWISEQGVDVARRVNRLIAINKLVANSPNSTSKLIHSKPLRQPGMWELCSVGAVRVVYSRTKDGNIVLLGGVDKKGRDWLQEELIERCKDLKERLDSGDELIHLIEI